MPKKTADEPTTPLARFGRIADTALIPPETRLMFGEALKGAIEHTIFVDDILRGWEELRSRKAHHRQSLRGIAKAAKELVEAIEQGTDGAKFCLWRAFWMRREQEGNISPEGVKQEFDSLLESLVTASSVASDALQHVHFKTPIPLRTPVGTLAMTHRHLAGQEFASRFILYTLKAGGRLTLEKTNRRGTLIEALNYCIPFLPVGFKFPSSSALQTIKSKIEKAASAHAGCWLLETEAGQANRIK